MVDYRDAVGEELYFRQSVGGEKQGSASGAQDLRFEEAAEFGGGDGVEATRGFIEQKNARLMHYGAREAEALHGAGGEGAHLAVQSFIKMKLLRKHGDAAGSCAGGELIEAAEKEKVLPGGEARVKAVVGAGVVAELATNGAGILRGVVAGDESASVRGQQEGRKDFQKRGLAGAIRAEERHGFAIANGKTDARERHGSGAFEGLKKGSPAAARGREKFFEMFDADRRWRH